MIKKSSSLKKRIITASILAPLVLAITYFAPSNVFSLLLLAFLILGAYEWANLSFLKNIVGRSAYIVFVAVIFLTVLVKSQTFPIVWILYLAAAWWLLILIRLMLKRVVNEDQAKHVDVMKLAAGLLTLLPGCIAMYLLHSLYGALMIFYVFLIVWGADIGAYFSGKRFGKHKLAPVLSPGKTLEGVAGGMLLVAVLSLLVGLYIFTQTIDIVYFVLIALVVALFSIVGDLYESLLKREAGVKDSSQLLPGHGGILDRIDSLLSAAPLFLLFYVLVY